MDARARCVFEPLAFILNRPESKALGDLRVALQGDGNLAREVLETLAGAIRETADTGKNDHAGLLRVAAEMLSNVAFGQDANAALLVKSKGRPKNARNLEFHIWLSVRTLLLRGESKMRAYKKVAEELKKKERKKTKLSEVDADLSASRVKQIYLAQCTIHDGRHRNQMV